MALLARTMSKESHRLYLGFWTAFQRRLGEARVDTLKPRRPERGYYTGYPIGRSGFRLGAVASLWDSKNQTYESNELRAELVVDGSASRRRFDALKERRDDIERELGFSLAWEKKPSVQRCRVYVRRTVNLHHRDAWPEYHRWLLDHLCALDRCFSTASRRAVSSASVRFPVITVAVPWTKLELTGLVLQQRLDERVRRGTINVNNQDVGDLHQR